MHETGEFGGGVNGQLNDWADRSSFSTVKSSIGMAQPAKHKCVRNGRQNGTLEKVC